MKLTAENLYDKKQTGREMHRVIKKYYSDLKDVYVMHKGKKVPVLNLTIEQFFNIVRKIRYKKDKKPVEVLSRPKYIFGRRNPAADCKKKSILIASYLKNKNIPYRLIASSNLPNKRIHHVFPQCKINGRWLNIDATYSTDKIYSPKSVTNYEVLK